MNRSQARRAAQLRAAKQRRRKAMIILASSIVISGFCSVPAMIDIGYKLFSNPSDDRDHDLHFSLQAASPDSLKGYTITSVTYGIQKSADGNALITLNISSDPPPKMTPTGAIDDIIALLPKGTLRAEVMDADATEADIRARHGVDLRNGHLWAQNKYLASEAVPNDGADHFVTLGKLGVAVVDKNRKANVFGLLYAARYEIPWPARRVSFSSEEVIFSWSLENMTNSNRLAAAKSPDNLTFVLCESCGITTTVPEAEHTANGFVAQFPVTGNGRLKATIISPSRQLMLNASYWFTLALMAAIFASIYGWVTKWTFKIQRPWV